MQQIPTFKIRASAASEILAGAIGLTDAQTVRRSELQDRKFGAANGEKGIKPLTPNMEVELATLNYKFDNPELPADAKSYCQKWLKEQLYERRKNFANKYLEKGLSCEDDSIRFAAAHFGWGDVAKNEEWFSDEWFEGTPDIICELFSRYPGPEGEVFERMTPTIIDMKNVWDCFTLPLFEDDIPTEGYRTQLQVYMHLASQAYGVPFTAAILCYALMDAPDAVMQKEMRRLSWEEGHQGLITDDIGERVRREMTYSNLAADLRLKTYTVTPDASVIEELKIRVEMCRKYIAGLVKSKVQVLQAA